MPKNKELAKIILECPEDILNRWDERARYIGIERTALILVGMNEYFESHPSSIKESPKIKQEITRDSKKVKKKRGRPPKSSKPEKKTEKKEKKPNSVDKRKTRLEQKKCPICHELFECRGLPAHLRKHDRESSKKGNGVVKIPQKTINRLRQNKMFEDVGIHGRDDFEIPSQILIKGNRISKKIGGKE